VKKRLDVLLVERGLAQSRAQAQALILAGLVPGHSKAGEQVDDGAELAVERPPRFVSRGGEKLAHALVAFEVDPTDPRVTVLERMNARTLTDLPFPPRLVVCDVSFISSRKVLPPALELAAPGWEALVLVKPQFEAGREEVGKGVVTSNEIRARVVREVAEAALAWGAVTLGVVDSGLPGPKGNRELFLHLAHRPGARIPAELDRWIDAAVG
jgi:23S rRNA (cytidine1920-2'-O)/16S rRNA (cytidine1409-2'-O)-methyltransferase